MDIHKQSNSCVSNDFQLELLPVLITENILGIVIILYLFCNFYSAVR